MKIMYLNGTLTGQTVELPPGGATIGRESDNAIQIPMGGVSRYHARIEQDPAGNWQIRDLGSTNGTQVDDFPVVGAARLVNGSVITIGDQLLRCMDSASASAPNPGPAAQAPSAPQPQSPSQSQPAFFFRPQNATSNTPIQEQPVPAPASQPASGPASPAAPPPPAPSITEAEISRGLFNKSKNKKQSKAPKKIHPKKLIGNIIFTLVVILAACFGLWLFLRLNEAPKTPVDQSQTKKKVDNPFVLYYEKESVAENSVFRFTLQIEGRREKVEDNREELHYIMEVTLDEPRNKRHYYELFSEPLPQDLIKSLEDQIQKSGFMDLQQEKIAGTSEDKHQHRRLMVGFGNKFCDVKVSTNMSETFNHVENIINETVLEKYDLGVVSQDVDQILQDARRYLTNATDAFRSIDTTPSNLLVAITNFKYAKRRYGLFENPKPPEWKLACEGLEKAEAKQEELYQKGRTDIKIFYELRDYEKAIAECNRLLAIFPPESETYKKIRDNKIKIEDKLSLRNK